MVHGGGDEGKGGGEAAPEKGVGGDGTGGAVGKRVDEVVEGALEDDEEAESDAGQADAGRDPGETFLSGPADDEDAGGEEDGPDHHGRQTRLGHCTIAGGVVFQNVIFLVQDVDGCADEDPRQDGEEWQGPDDVVPAALLFENDRDGSQEHVHDSIDEGGVQGDAETDGRAENLDRSDQKLVSHIFDTNSCRPLFVQGVQSPIAGFVSQFGSFLDQEGRWVGLVKEDDIKGQEK